MNDEPWVNTGPLANSDTTHYFFCDGVFQDYLVAPETLGLLAFLTGRASSCDCVCETDVEVRFLRFLAIHPFVAGTLCNIAHC